MPNILLTSPLAIVLGFLSIILTILYLREYNLRRKQAAEGERISKQIRDQSFHMLEAAEIAEEKVIADSKYSTSVLEEEYKKKLQEIFKNSQDSVTQAQSQLIGYMMDLQKRSQEFEEAARSSSQQRINQLFQRLESRLSDFLIKTETATTSSIELELKSARQLIEAYKAQQLGLIDENIIAMMEQTLSLVLSKKLSLKDQLDLVYEALEKAKVEKFIV